MSSGDNTPCSDESNEVADVCLCGCPVADHDRYEEGLSCEHDDHECLPVWPSVLSIVNDLRAALAVARDANAELRRTNETLNANWGELATRHADLRAKLEGSERRLDLLIENRSYASVRERAVWHHERGEHDLPFEHCALCERDQARAELADARAAIQQDDAACSAPDYCLAHARSEAAKWKDRAEHAEAYIEDATTSGGAVRVAVAQAREALAELLTPTLDPSAWYDREAEDFYHESGFMAPGKSRPMAMGGQDEEQASKLWRAFREKRNSKIVERAKSALAALAEVSP